ncbi:hypothetical protein TVAG_479210 [Trichomonas vaginalis G3]|uniref:Trafficking protein particle complex subunit n=1 Tax=Trichomonas vaginalis (strain ATCC PRA-98 / G3) TaxID=412133 RepID=A2FVR1_TRIV3|nr:hypothetical protein TVAGG3_0156670 [Trichomonas vaginalis G3]EAX91013.1 hypothetical protein TVAG_479210 [Trichomonas vaginalis G3]KAI5547595.1 hypothetical protein TVAGG3_0156670 [Trichomonas vaginalis G3]|eukprot:XP_001303943.1 hypothetical protein [Trichomonas vaginalis G3]
MTFPSSLISVSVIGPDKSPIYIKKNDDEKESLEVEATLFEAIQIIDALPPKIYVRSSDRLLARVHKTDKFTLWAYKASLNYIIIAITPTPLIILEKVMLQFLEKVKDAMFYAFTDPFYNSFAPLTSKIFDQKVLELSASVVPQTVSGSPQ